MKPLISVLIPHYNYIQYVPTAIDSVLNQSYPNVEIVVTDNQSTDGAVPILRARYVNEPRIRIIENERNLGMTGNFNRSLQYARGEYVLWLSSDDFMLRPHLERLQAVFDREPGIDVVYSSAYFADEAGHIYSIRQLPGQFPVDYVDARDELVEQITTVCPLCLPTALFPRALLEEMGPMDDDEYLAADWEYAIRMAAAGKRFAYLADPSMAMRLHGDQASGDVYQQSGRNLVDFVGYVTKYVDHPCMERMRGRERKIIVLMDGMRSDVLAVNETSPFSAQADAAFEQLRKKLLDRADVHEPAQARSRTVSVIVQAIGPPQCIVEAIDSVADQTFPNVEIVVVDHGAFPLESILRSHRAWKRISYLRHPNQIVPGSALNFGLRMARGEYIIVLDPDSRFAPDHVESLLATIERSGSQVAVASARLIVDRASTQLVAFEQVAEAGIYRTESDFPGLGEIASALPLDAVLFYRGLNERAGIFSEQIPMLEDFEFLLRLERITRFAWSGERTLSVHVRLGFAAQIFGSKLGNYLNVLDAVYRAYPVPEPLAKLRTAQRASVARALETASQVIESPQGMAEFMATLAGRSVIAIPAPS